MRAIPSPLLGSFRTAVASAVLLGGLLLAAPSPSLAQADDEELETIGSDSCIDCHDESREGSLFADDIEHSAHEGFECMDCHSDRGTIPHVEQDGFSIGSDACSECRR